ncbi:Peptidase propeptide and YPEB domain protein [Marinobacterium sp. xm-a-127]|jgi:uncharacterized membrane protein YkoI|nr:Peptidase propeptide and YPEB domain protein [Marinobacterium sp. xm-g-48]NRP14845.1 Peptidase propeptide and YPEB domain protein [Marinobacterium sp. xm-a-152]NRP46695.1 Peptidase propeptide and YPEB domain protein [Marinobacterium sp. xm-d-543]NRP58098.1 Peptidase propeptide and YPEB domain protein [Marinobacterium sp. xm-d-510]NRP83732.1 Peptidase propeptide and YPEB domain protein [Marinobacterium sp. xm-d-509]NRP98329.1 Peptidase propeptide and YPEB domain protein [Marinobacterium sp. 
MTTRSIFRITAAGIINLLALSLPSIAGDNLSQREARELLESGHILSLSELQDRHAQTFIGKILDLELERKDGKLIYEFEVLGGDGEVREYYIDAASGELLQEKLED